MDSAERSSNGNASASPPPPRPVVVCGPSGVGKGTLIELLQKRFPDGKFGFSVSHTTRKPREGEVDGTHYNFTTVEKIREEIKNDKFVEYAEVHGNYYGTSVEAVRSVQSQGKICILDIDVQGVRNVKKSTLDPVYVFVAPPSMEALEARLRGRGTETEEAIQKRLGNAATELEYGEEKGNFDRVFVNNDLEKTFETMTEAFVEWYPSLLSAARPVVVCGPSGVGKGTLIEMLQKRFPDGKFGFSVSHTTRKPREGEVDGKHYNFTTVDKIRKEIEDGKFVEYAEVHGNYYGTSVEAVRSVQSQGKICILDIDVQGVRNVKKSTLNPVYIFVSPPSMEALEARLRGRGTETEEAIQKRLGNAATELEYGEGKGNFDRVFVNNDLEKTFETMAEAFVEWYPSLLSSGEGKEEASGSAAEASAKKQEMASLPQSDIDPLSFPQTDDGLSAFLSEVDSDCPLEGYGPTEMTYSAKSIRVAAGQALDVPLPPVEHDGSKIDWSVTVVDEHQERLDIQFGLAVIVDGEEVIARDMSRILAPQPQMPDEGEGAVAVATTILEPSARGKFTVANSAPATIVIKLDNKYSWFIPKKVDYSFTIIPPVDINMVERSNRAKGTLSRVTTQIDAANDARSTESSRIEALDRIKSELEVKRSAITKAREEGQKDAEQSLSRVGMIEAESQEKVQEAEETQALVAKEEKSLGEVTDAISALEAELARLQKRLEELKIEKTVREEERSKLVQSVVTKMQEQAAREGEAAARRAEAESKSKELDGLVAQSVMIEDNLRDLAKERADRAVEEEKYTAQALFFKRQADALKMRFL